MGVGDRVTKSQKNSRWGKSRSSALSRKEGGSLRRNVGIWAQKWVEPVGSAPSLPPSSSPSQPTYCRVSSDRCGSPSAGKRAGGSCLWDWGVRRASGPFLEPVTPSCAEFRGLLAGCLVAAVLQSKEKASPHQPRSPFGNNFRQDT